jgi:hypothetical protein
MIVFTNLFTVSEKDPSENRYVDMFWIWCKYMEKNSGLTEQDTVYLLVDSRTCDYIESIIKYLPTDLIYTMIEYKPPLNSLEGMLRRYSILSYPMINPSETILYMDIDVLCIGNIKSIESQVPMNSLYLWGEDKLIDNFHLEELLTAEKMRFILQHNLSEHEGFTAGWFLFKGIELNKLFHEIVVRCKNGKQTCISFEQPYFCEVVFEVLFEQYLPQITIQFANKTWFQVNMIHQLCPPSTLFLNLCGDPGKEQSHWLKMFGTILSDY